MNTLFECVKRDITENKDRLLFHAIGVDGNVSEENGLLKIEILRTKTVISANAIIVGMSYEFDEILKTIHNK